MNEPLAVLILAAGLGSRLKPLTDRLPKPLVPVVDRSILEHQVHAVFRLREFLPVHSIYANAFHLQEQIVAAAPLLGIDHVQVESPRLQGTGTPLRRIQDEGFQGEILVLNGDSYHHFDLADFVRAARASGEHAALLLVDHAPTNVVGCDARGRVCSRAGRYSVGNAVRSLTYSGVAWYSREAIGRILYEDHNIVDFWQREAESGRLPLAYTSQTESTWIDMGTPEGLYRACEARLLELGLDRWVHPSAQIAGCDIGPGCVVGEGVCLEPGSTLRHCILLPGTRLDEGQQIQRTIHGPGFSWLI